MPLKIQRFPANARFESMLEIAQQYAAAIQRRDRGATDPWFLAEVWTTNGSYFVRYERNFLILYKVGEIYVASHFAPETMRGGWKLIKKVAESGLPICFAVPADLAVDLARMGWVRLPAWLNNLISSVGIPEGKEVLIPRNMLSIAWKVFRSSTRDVWSRRETSPAEIVDEEEADRLLGLRDDLDMVISKADAEWSSATTLANFWPV